MPTKTWGPFNGRQLSTIIVALVIGVVMVPAGAWAAVTFKSVAVTDPAGVNQAKVDAAGSLQAADAPATKFVSARLDLSGSTGSLVVAAPPAGKALVVKTIQVDTTFDPAPAPGEVTVFFVGASSCSGGRIGTSAPTVTPAGLGATVLPFDPGLAVPAGDALCGESLDNQATGVAFTVNVYGIIEPSAAVPSPG
jgi:hypothetical protein